MCIIVYDATYSKTWLLIFVIEKFVLKQRKVTSAKLPAARESVSKRVERLHKAAGEAPPPAPPPKTVD